MEFGMDEKTRDRLIAIEIIRDRKQSAWCSMSPKIKRFVNADQQKVLTDIVITQTAVSFS